MRSVAAWSPSTLVVYRLRARFHDFARGRLSAPAALRRKVEDHHLSERAGKAAHDADMDRGAGPNLTQDAVISVISALQGSSASKPYSIEIAHLPEVEKPQEGKDKE